MKKEMLSSDRANKKWVRSERQTKTSGILEEQIITIITCTERITERILYERKKERGTINSAAWETFLK